MSAPSIYLQDAPHARSRAHPFSFFRTAWVHRDLIYRLARREVEVKYKGSLLGLAWAVVVPLMMLGVYTLVFSVMLHIGWNLSAPGTAPGTSALPSGKIPPTFLIIFAGMICLNLFADCVARAPSLMLSNVSYIKKVVFPLEILPLVILACELFNALVGTIVLAGIYGAFVGRPPVLALLLPVIVLPLVLTILGLLWFISSLGVYLRDLRQLIAVLLSVIGLVSPVFFPLSNFPQKVRWIVCLNPLTIPLEQVRDVLFKNLMPDWRVWLGYLLASWIIAWAGYLWFEHAQRGFADVV